MGMKISRALLLGLVLAASSAAFAQYSWVGPDGHRVFSDHPPPNDVPEKNVLTRPGKGGGVFSEPTEGEAPAASAASSAQAGVDKSLEEKKKQADAEQAAKEKAEADRVAAAKADNCKRATKAKATLDTGMRVRRVNSKGESEVMNDDQRAAETARLQKVIAEDCK
jgi:hypothetical protein